MSEHNSDELTATGTHRIWTGEPARTPVRAAGAGEPQRDWADNPRHAAITRSLHSWTNYKSWTDRIRDSWKDEDK